jgi:NitT/TauT family transport system substrate-binding protein
MRKAGIPLSEVRFVELPNMQAVVEAVRKKTADVGFVNSGFELNAQIQGLAVPFPVAKYAPDAPCCRQTASRTAIERDREPYVRFQVANLRAMKTMLEEPELTVKTLAAYSGQSSEYVKYCIYDSVMKISMDPRKSRVLEFYQTMKDNGDIRADTPFSMENAVDDTIYKEALERVLKRWPGNEHFIRMQNAAE